MPSPTGLRIHKDTSKDILMVSQVTKGKYGAAQLQVALNLSPIRELAKKILDSKSEDIMGAEATPRAVSQLTNRLAVRGLCGLSLNAGQSPIAALAKQATQSAMKSQGSKYVRVNAVVAAYQKDKLAKYGGFDGLKQKMAVKRNMDANAMLAKGIPPQIVNAKKVQQEKEDEFVLSEAAKQVGLEHVKTESSDDEASGFSLNPFKRKKKGGGGTPEQRLAAAQDRIDRANALKEALDAEAAAKEAEDATKDGGDAAAYNPDGGAKDGNDEAAQAAAAGDLMGALSKLSPRARAIFKKRLHMRRMRNGFYHHFPDKLKTRMSGDATRDAAVASVVPGGPATLAVAKLASKKGGKKHARAALRLAKARQGDKDAIKQIKETNKKAKAGDPNAKAEMARLNMVNKAAMALERRPGFMNKWNGLLRSGVAGFKPSTKEASSGTIEDMHGDLLSSGCS